MGRAGFEPATNGFLSPLRRLRCRLIADSALERGSRLPVSVKNYGCPREPVAPGWAPSGLDHPVRGIRATEADVNLSVLCQLLVRFASSASCPGPADLSEEQPRRVLPYVDEPTASTL